MNLFSHLSNRNVFGDAIYGPSEPQVRISFCKAMGQRPNDALVIVTLMGTNLVFDGFGRPIVDSSGQS